MPLEDYITETMGILQNSPGTMNQSFPASLSADGSEFVP
jgi:hypothetical protein